MTSQQAAPGGNLQSVIEHPSIACAPARAQIMQPSHYAGCAGDEHALAEKLTPPTPSQRRRSPAGWDRWGLDG
jgi:hypothetical protein